MGAEQRAAGVLRVAVFSPLRKLLDYAPPAHGDTPAPGALVRVPLGSGRARGVIVEIAANARRQRLKRVLEVLQPTLLDAHLLALARWCWSYYQHPPGQVLATIVPGYVREHGTIPETVIEAFRLTAAGASAAAADLARAPRQRELWQLLVQGPCTDRELAARQPKGWRQTLTRMQNRGWVESCTPPQQVGVGLPRPGPQLSAEQAVAVEAITAKLGEFDTVLLFGITGSGKTEVYIHALRAVLERGAQALVLVPEIGLTPQLVQGLERRLGLAVTVLHSGMTARQRAESWGQARTGQARVVLGTRSAVFVPLQRPGLIVVDEEQDASYKQFEGFQYSARDVAVRRAQMLDVPVVLGSATPSLESLDNVERGRYRMLRLSQRAGGALEPEWRLLDLRGEAVAGGLGADAERALAETLDAGGQVLVFLNRRGFAPVLLCQACGWHADCPRCSAYMTWHQTPPRLICHHCGRIQSRPELCPDCDSPNLVAAGAGTERLQQWLEQRFGGYPVYRVDRDVMQSRGALEELRESVLKGEPCVLVGTQMLSKGHHFPGITLVLVADADQALYSADFHAAERLAQQLIQVAGRAGRGCQPGRVLIQTRHPEHPLLQLLTAGDYARVAQRLVDERRAAGLPPAAAHAMLRAEARDQERLRDFLQQAVAAAPRYRGVEIQGPFPAVMERRAGRYRMQVWLQAPRRAQVQTVLREWVPRIAELPGSSGARWQWDVDPIEL